VAVRFVLKGTHNGSSWGPCDRQEGQVPGTSSTASGRQIVEDDRSSTERSCSSSWGSCKRPPASSLYAGRAARQLASSPCAPIKPTTFGFRTVCLEHQYFCVSVPGRR